MTEDLIVKLILAYAVSAVFSAWAMIRLLRSTGYIPYSDLIVLVGLSLVPIFNLAMTLAAAVSLLPTDFLSRKAISYKPFGRKTRI